MPSSGGDVTWSRRVLSCKYQTAILLRTPNASPNATKLRDTSASAGRPLAPSYMDFAPRVNEIIDTPRTKTTTVPPLPDDAVHTRVPPPPQPRSRKQPASRCRLPVLKEPALGEPWGEPLRHRTSSTHGSGARLGAACWSRRATDPSGVAYVVAEGNHAEMPKNPACAGQTVAGWVSRLTRPKLPIAFVRYPSLFPR